MIIRRWLEDVLGFSQSEAKGTTVLIIVVIVTAIIPRIVFFTQNSGSINGISNQEELNVWSKKIASIITEKKSDEDFEAVKNKVTRPATTKLKPSLFDPNKVTSQELIMMGIDEWLAKRLSKYKAKGGKFYKKEDLKKIYGLNNSVYNQLEPFIHIEAEKKLKELPSVKEKNPIKRVDINVADTSHLMQINGIGSKLSNRIVKFRNKLGGFHDPKQLFEVYGLDSGVIQQIALKFYIEQKHEKLTINTDSIKYLASHPYINFKLARAIINYRKTHGPYKSIDEIQALKNLDDSTYNKIAPYLRLN